MKKISYNSIKDAIMDGYVMHGFSSGGRLRVLYLKKKGVKKEFYGEGFNYTEAMRILGDDVKAGGRKYKDVYGKLEPHYWTGAYPTEDVVDNWLYQGHRFDVFARDGEIVVKLKKTHILHTPKSIVSVVTIKNATMKWKFKDFKSIYTSTSTKFPNGDAACQTSVEQIDGEDGWIKEFEFEGISPDLSVAMTNAFVKSNRELEFEIL